jgi:hypothetical protein
VAKRAQSILGHLDLEAIASHDPLAVAKLSSVASAIKALDDGEDVGYVPGIDVNEQGPPVLDPRQVRKAELMALLGDAGFADQLGRVYIEGEDPPDRALDAVPHQDGLPPFDICVAPQFSPTAGAHGIFISSRGVFSVMVPEPILENRWRVLRSVPYDEESEMLAIVKRYVARPAAGES